MQLGNCNFSEFKLGIDSNGTNPEEDDGEADEDALEDEQSTRSGLRFAHLGFQAHPTITPTKTAIQRGAMNINSSLKTSQIVGRCKISNKEEAKAI